MWFSILHPLRSALRVRPVAKLNRGVELVAFSRSRWVLIVWVGFCFDSFPVFSIMVYSTCFLSIASVAAIPCC